MLDGNTLYLKQERLLDCSDPEIAALNGYSDYGRFALLRDGGIWFGDVRSCHPSTTHRGWYWALVERNCLILSPRGARTDGDYLFDEGKPIIASLLEELERQRVIRHPSVVRIVESVNNEPKTPEGN